MEPSSRWCRNAPSARPGPLPAPRTANHSSIYGAPDSGLAPASAVGGRSMAAPTSRGTEGAWTGGTRTNNTGRHPPRNRDHDRSLPHDRPRAEARHARIAVPAGVVTWQTPGPGRRIGARSVSQRRCNRGRRRGRRGRNPVIRRLARRLGTAKRRRSWPAGAARQPSARRYHSRAA